MCSSTTIHISCPNCREHSECQSLRFWYPASNRQPSRHRIVTRVDGALPHLDGARLVVDSALRIVDSALGTIDSALRTIDSALRTIDSALGTIDSALRIVDGALGTIDSASFRVPEPPPDGCIEASATPLN